MPRILQAAIAHFLTTLLSGFGIFDRFTGGSSLVVPTFFGASTLTATASSSTDLALLILPRELTDRDRFLEEEDSSSLTPLVESRLFALTCGAFNRDDLELLITEASFFSTLTATKLLLLLLLPGVAAAAAVAGRCYYYYPSSLSSCHSSEMVQKYPQMELTSERCIAAWRQ